MNSQAPKIEFRKGVKYNAMQTMAPSALANGHEPLCYIGLIYQDQEKDENGVIELRFTYEGEDKWFDDDFVNNGRTHDNSMIFVESNKQ